MPSQKRKDLSDDDDDAPPRFYQPRSSLSPAPSPKRRRCDVLENGMSQLTLDGRSLAPPALPALAATASFFGAGASVGAGYPAPTIYLPDTHTAPVSQVSSTWTDALHAPYITHVPTDDAVPVVLPGSVEEPTSPEHPAAADDTDAQDVRMRHPSWYEIEKDRTSASFAPSPPPTPPPPSAPSHAESLLRRAPRPTVVDAPARDIGIVVTDLEDSDTEDEDTRARPHATTAGDGAKPAFTVSPALLGRLPKAHQLGPLLPEPGPSTALVLYRPLTIPAESDGDAPDRREEKGELQPMREDEEPMEDARPWTPMVESVDDPVDEPMDIEML